MKQYDKSKILEAAKQITTKNKSVVFIEQLVAHLGISKSTFYDYIKNESDESNAIKEMLNANRVNIYTNQLKKWADSDNATLQIGLMKLIGTEEMAHRLNGTKQEIKTEGDMNLNVNIIEK